MDKEREIIHKIFDNDADDAEKKLVAKWTESDPGLREEFSGLKGAVDMLEESERREPPMFFTAEVMKKIEAMKKLPKARPSIAGRIREFFFGSRVLRWNMASALGATALVIVALATITLLHRTPAINTAGIAEPVATVHLTFNAPQARSVAVAGDFNKWRTDANEMRNTNGTWSIDVKLKPGVYSYSFVVDGKSWVPDPGAESYQDDGLGSRNAVLRVNI